jgi:hypothetical protein
LLDDRVEPFGRTRERTHPHRVGLAGAGGGVQQAAAAVRDRGPHVALERERLPAPAREPGLGIGSVRSHRAIIPRGALTR